MVSRTVSELRIFSIILLLLNGVAAFVGGLLLMIDPTGAQLQLSLQLLQHTLFVNYFLPGIILFITNGLLSVAAALWVLFKWRNYPVFIMLQGYVLTGWVVIQMLLLQIIYFQHIVMGAIGLLLIISGTMIRKVADKEVR